MKIEIDEEEKHSPGPWTLDNDDELNSGGGYWTIRDASGKLIVRIPVTEHDATGSRKYLDARLMSESACLLERAIAALQMAEIRDGTAIIPEIAIKGLERAVRDATR